MDFAEPIKYPLKDLKKLIIGGILVFPGVFLLIPAGMAIGYTIKVAGDTVRGRDELPEFGGWWDLFIKGIEYLVINIIYTIIIVAAIFPAFALFIIGKGNIAFMILSVILGIVAFIPVIILVIMSRIAIIRYSERGYIGSALAFREILKNFKANLGDYIIGSIILVVLGNITDYVVDFITRITIVGIIFAGVIWFYNLLVVMRMFAQIYKESKVKLGDSENL